jgi:hypothetical protein
VLCTDTELVLEQYIFVSGTMYKIVALAIVLASMTMVAADCSSNPELCQTGFDETSLVQLRSIYQHRDGNASEVEDAQDAVKAADSNATIQKYAASVAKRHRAEAIYTALKKHAKAEHDTQANVNAVRAAATALQAAKDEEDAWKAAVQASTDAQAEAKIADADAAAKHALTMNATATHQQTMANLSAARTNLTDTQIVQQQLVNDAAAEAHSQFALQAKTEAAKARAEQKAAESNYNEKVKQEQLARKKKWQTSKQSMNDEWKAHSKSLNAQKSAQEAAGAGILKQEMVLDGEAPAEADAEAALGLLQDEEDEKNVTMVTYNESNVLAVKATADSAVQAAETAVDQGVSDEKAAKAAQDVAVYAAEQAAISQKVAYDKQDSAYYRAQHASRVAAKAARAAREADEAIKQTNFTLNLSSIANASAGDAANVSEPAYYKQLEMVRETSKTLGEAKVAYDAAFKNATLQKTIAAAAVDADMANTSAQIAATSRAVSDYAKEFEVNASANESAALANLTAANAQAKQANQIAGQAKGAAVHAATQAQKYDRKAAVVTLFNSTDAATKTTVVETEPAALESNKPAALG